MARKPNPQRREDSLSRERIIDAAIELLDASGEAGLTFRALAERLATGPGAIYWHVADKSDLLTAACDALMARTLEGVASEAAPDATIRAVALGVFDAIAAHPWIGSALTMAPGQSPGVRILERLGQSVCALGVPEAAQWSTVSVLLSYILGVGSQHATNMYLARAQSMNRASLLADVAKAWSELDADDYPFTRGIAARMSAHDDREDFLAGVNLILGGIGGASSG